LLPATQDQVESSFLPKFIVPPLIVETRRTLVFLKMLFDLLYFFLFEGFLDFVFSGPELPRVSLCRKILKLILETEVGSIVIDVDIPVQKIYISSFVDQNSSPIFAFVEHPPH
jgi:hypothetical protein